MSVRWKSVIGPFVETTMPSVTRVAHAGIGRGAPSTSTTHMRQPPYGIELRVVAERRDERAVPRGRVDEQLALAARDGAPVEGELDHEVMLQRPPAAQ